MKPEDQLPLSFTKAGYTYKQERRGKRCAIYSQQWSENGVMPWDGVIFWEVVIPQIKYSQWNDAAERWEAGPAREIYPHSELWGIAGWTFVNIEDAVKKYHSINDRNSVSRGTVRRKTRFSCRRGSR